ncbi:MAG: hypothetical protein M3O31_12190 [Acidobacteriota bacterium]|nr:hypothetical protein [Acidobacteriota bacterium]
MESNAGTARQLSRKVVLAFVALALMFGPATTLASPAFESAMHWQVLTGVALSSSLAGSLLLVASFLRRERLPNLRQCEAVILLLAPRLLVLALASHGPRPWLHETGWGVAFLLSLAAPLWLGLLSALRIVSIEVPRTLVAASIAAIGAVLLWIPTGAYALKENQVPMLLVHFFVNVAGVFTWWFARQRLGGAAVLPTAGLFLLLSAGVSGVSAVVSERGAWQPVDWRDAALPILFQVLLAAGSYWLWFYLLVRMPLTGFSLHPLAIWIASTLVGLFFVFFMTLRLDLAVAIAVGAVVVALRAQVADEQPTALGLGGA